jgi:hypothetical protein
MKVGVPAFGCQNGQSGHADVADIHKLGQNNPMKLYIALIVSAFAVIGPASHAQEIRTSTRANQLVSATPINPANWVTTSDRERSGSNAEGLTRFELTISPAGSVERCRITDSSGFAALDQLTCSLMMSRGHFRPGKDQGAVPIASTFASQIIWAKPGRTWDVPGPRPYLSLVIARLPEHLTTPAYVRVLAVVGTGGEVEACEGQGKGELAVLNIVACQQLGHEMLDLVSLDQAGKPRRILRSLLVEFSTN